MFNHAYEIVKDSIVPENLESLCKNIECGALVSFYGKVRRYNLGKEVTHIKYQVAQPLATTLFAQFAHKAMQQWTENAEIIIVHRQGCLQLGDISIAILVSTPHRKEAYAMNHFLIETIKTHAPIWKKEYYVDGESDWVKGHALCQHA